jgi:hypothetical protein
MSDKSSDNAFGLMVLSSMLLAFALGVNAGASLERRRHCEAPAKASLPAQAPAARDSVALLALSKRCLSRDIN